MSSSDHRQNNPEQNGDWLEYWLAETKAVADASPEQQDPLFEPRTVGLPAPPKEPATVPPAEIPPPPLTGVQVYQPPKVKTVPAEDPAHHALPWLSKPPVRRKSDLPEDFIRVDSFTEPPSGDVVFIEAPIDETGVLGFDPELLNDTK